MLPSDMIQDFIDHVTMSLSGTGLLPSIANLQMGSGLLMFLPGSIPGDYC